jgi:hypothetical protein
MYKKQSAGFAHLLIFVIGVLVAVIVAVAFFVVKNNNKSQTSNENENSASNNVTSESQLTIYNLGIASLDDLDITNDATRDFTKSGHKGMYIFGDILPGTPVRHNPNFEFASVKEGTKLISAIEGEVAFVKSQSESNDYEVFLTPNEQSDWMISYDHVSDLKVQKGDKVKVGDQIGYPTRQGNGFLRFEFQVNKDQEGTDGIHICPITLLDSSVKESWLAELRSTQDSWEEISGLELYDPASQDPVGCLFKKMTPAYAQGATE